MVVVLVKQRPPNPARICRFVALGVSGALGEAAQPHAAAGRTQGRELVLAAMAEIVALVRGARLNRVRHSRPVAAGPNGVLSGAVVPHVVAVPTPRPERVRVEQLVSMDVVLVKRRFLNRVRHCQCVAAGPNGQLGALVRQHVELERTLKRGRARVESPM